MKITALVENTSQSELKAWHGLSLYIETRRHKLLFDVGPDGILFHNAGRLGIDLAEIDTVIISHGHTDHGGALGRFLKLNPRARVYIQRKAFESHSYKALFLKLPVGLDKALASHPQITLLDGDYQIDEELSLFTVTETSGCRSPLNDILYDPRGRDDFSHEQDLLIMENGSALIMGCGHAGVVNIMDRVKSHPPEVCVGGFHLYDPATRKTAPEALLNEIALALKSYKDTRFYTCHCTGEKVFQHLKRQIPNLNYLSCGETIHI